MKGDADPSTHTSLLYTCRQGVSNVVLGRGQGGRTSLQQEVTTVCSPPIEGRFGLSLWPFGGTGLESQPGKGREREKGREIENKDIQGSLTVWLALGKGSRCVPSVAGLACGGVGGQPCDLLAGESGGLRMSLHLDPFLSLSSRDRLSC